MQVPPTHRIDRDSWKEQNFTLDIWNRVGDAIMHTVDQFDNRDVSLARVKVASNIGWLIFRGVLILSFIWLPDCLLKPAHRIWRLRRRGYSTKYCGVVDADWIDRFQNLHTIGSIEADLLISSSKTQDPVS